MRTDKLFFLLNKYNLKPSKNFSQNFLISDEILSFMASQGKGRVLEIGPGLGFLTEKLSKVCDKVIAVEKDKNLVNILNREYNFDNVEIICEDFLKFEEKKFDTVVSSIPYAISSQITFKLFEMNFESATLLYQKEFALRFISKPGEDDYSRLSVMSKINSEIEILRDVPPEAFFPEPKVWSSVVKITPDKKFEINEVFENTVRALFTHRNKIVLKAIYHSRDIFGKGKEFKRLIDEIPFKDRRVYTLNIYEIKEISDWLEGLL
ncbi:MAG: putative ribosomal RNA small subunit methyltransferase A [Candidatus Methanofastidiosum methylothiophilum]|jgi:16S rRNA (adenine1518-N6/adenine1519-N6)-dimethyltransferase|uniref:Probable ribosomal RNA small subunit methyltransferase A n=1 Tax=Candidatus Methanofastidiosum methylothiophilum TaxID=1705564 RepID=A0A150IMM1_9EURY|nr:MAG: putative ribosomal RNA small subunit methyltransferase A [Candidatus Methanofastidiosum methylthiophilus]NMC76875.1 ribosomal RNA small subunit methyltransferase A [Candidatus Methanofastidiosa archaeon]